MEATEIEQATHPEASTFVVLQRCDPRFANLRGVRWRINLGILPTSPSSSIDDLRRVTADSRRRYAALRRRLIVDPQMLKDAGSSSRDLAIDNPLSQNPASTWGRFFRNAELEKTFEQDLSRLYPEHGSFFQSPGCQGMLRRILLMWCLVHPDVGYRQVVGMHELLAPFLYVLHLDVENISEARKKYEDHFTDRFDDLSVQESDFKYRFDLKNVLDTYEDEIDLQGNSQKIKSLDELDPEMQAIIALSDAYGAEGELGVVLSEKFMEHDAYCMFNALMNGLNGSVSMADFFTNLPAVGSVTGLSPVIEASAVLYHLLSIVDSSLHSHLVELGVEPQYFCLRWFRVLFGREFSLNDLLIVWDEIFSAENSNSEENDSGVESGSGFQILSSPRGALISAMALSIILYLRSSLLGTEYATSSLQRLLNLPESIELGKIIERARSLQALALDVSRSSSTSINASFNPTKAVRGHSLPADSISMKARATLVPESYWEARWRILHKVEEARRKGLGTKDPQGRKRWSAKIRLSLSRTESNPQSLEVEQKENMSSVKRNLLEDLSQQLGSENPPKQEDEPSFFSLPDNQVNLTFEKNNQTHNGRGSIETEEDRENGIGDTVNCERQEGSSESAASEGPSLISSDSTSQFKGVNHQENDSGSSVASNWSRADNNSHYQKYPEQPLPELHPPEQCIKDFSEKPSALSKCQWRRKFGRTNCLEESSHEKGTKSDSANSVDVGSSRIGVDVTVGPPSLSSYGKADGDALGALRDMGLSMLDCIQVIESVIQKDLGQPGSPENITNVDESSAGQVTAMAALEELRKIGRLLSEM